MAKYLLCCVRCGEGYLHVAQLPAPSLFPGACDDCEEMVREEEAKNIAMWPSGWAGGWASGRDGLWRPARHRGYLENEEQRDEL